MTMKMRVKYFVLLLVVLSMRQSPLAHAQVLMNPTAEQLQQIVRSQPPIEINAPVTASASFDPPLVRPGEKSVYRVTFNATAVSVSWPEKIPAPPELIFRKSASGQIMQPAGGSFQMFSTFDYDIRATGPGQFTIPEFTVEVYGKPVVVPATQLEVKTDLSQPHEPARQLVVEPSATNVFIGEVFNVRVRLPGTASGAIEGLTDVQVTGEGFVVDKNTVRQSISMANENGRNIPNYFYETSITPIAAGKVNLSAQGFTAGMQFGGTIVINGQASISGGQPKFNLLDSEPVVINVRSLPTESELPGFTGTVGSFTCDPPSLTTNLLKVGEPVQLTVVIRGEKNLSRINPPLPPRAQGWQIFPAERGPIVAANGMANPGATFKYTLIPLTDALQKTPVIPFSCFDPVLGKFINVTIPPLPVIVSASTLQTNADSALMLTENTTEVEKKSSLTKLASAPGWTSGSLVPLQMRRWFPLVQILPAFGFCGLWFWDRRRRFLEQHPEIVRRREARRALRRELRALDQAADTTEFVRCGVSALQIVTAPHYPATPRALVCGDVLQILTGSEREGQPGEIVRRFFNAADAAAFANTAQTKADLLVEKSALKNILKTLEARL